MSTEPSLDLLHEIKCARSTIAGMHLSALRTMRTPEDASMMRALYDLREWLNQVIERTERAAPKQNPSVDANLLAAVEHFETCMKDAGFKDAVAYCPELESAAETAASALAKARAE